MRELTLLATAEWGALLDALAAVSMDLTRIAESKSISEKAKIERLRFDLIVIDAVATALKKAGGLDSDADTG